MFHSPRTTTYIQVEAAANYVFGSKPQCRAANATAIEPGRSLVLYPANDTNACGFTFGISFRCDPGRRQ